MYLGLHGDNMKDPSKNKLAEWYRGDTFFGVLDELSLANRDGDAPLRIPVMDKIRDQGLFLSGKIEQGCIRVDYHVQLLP
jgi:translation elongation factor EF-1alpha